MSANPILKEIKFTTPWTTTWMGSTSLWFFAFQDAQIWSKKVTEVDDANVLETSRLWFVRSTQALQMYHVRDFDVIVTGNMFGNIQCLASFAEIDAIHVPWGTVRTEWRKRARHCGTGKGKYSRANFALHWCSCQFETEVAAIEVAVVEVLESGLLTGSCTGTIETVQFPPAPW